MGLLDEAIRDHLELKRRRGADPAEVAREQHEALEPVADRARADGVDESREGAPADSDADGELAQTPGEEAILSVDAGSLPHAEAESPAGAGAITGMEETAELDMKAVFQHATTHEPDDAVHVDQPIPGQEHLHFEQDAAAHAESER